MTCSKTESSSSVNETYHPALLIGLGGTGIRTLRFIRWLAENGGDTDLANALANNRLHLLGFDTDDDSNTAAEIDNHVLPRPSGWRGEWSSHSRQLPCLDSAFHLIPTQNINNTLSILQRTLHERDQQVKNNGYWSYYDWLPQGGHEALKELDSGQSATKGASQWRPLGRMALCSEAEKIAAALLSAAKGVECHLSHHDGVAERLRVHLVCSLSGGTGAGMFWDIAFLLRDLMPSTIISGSFLLADSFVGAANTHRVQANCYAALKELSVYKNWMMMPGERLNMRYQMDGGTKTLERTAGDHSEFDTVYLYRTFKPAGGPARGQDVTRTLLDTNCLRIAETLVARQRHDIREKLDTNGRNARTDIDSLRSEREREYVFSTATAVRLELGNPEQAALGLRAALFRRFHERTGGSGIQTLGSKALVETLGDALPPVGGDILRKEGTLAAAWIDGMKAQARDIQDKAKVRWQALLKAIREGAVRIQNGDYPLDWQGEGRSAQGAVAKDRAEAVRALYGRIDQDLRDVWKTALLSSSTDAGQSGATLAAFLAADLSGCWQTLTARLTTLQEKMASSVMLLDPETLRCIKMSLPELEAWQPESGAASLPSIIGVPVSLHHMRAELGLYPPQDTDAMKKALQRWQGGPIDQMFARLCNDLEQAIANVQPTTPQWEGLVRDFVFRHREGMVAALRGLLKVNGENREILARRNAQVNDAAYSSVNKAHLDPGRAYDIVRLALQPISDELLRLRVQAPGARSHFGGLPQDLADLTGIIARDLGLVDAITELPADLRKKWSRFMELLAEDLEANRQSPPHDDTRDQQDAERFVAKLIGPFDEVWFQSLEPDVLKSDPLFEMALKRIVLLANTFAKYWLEQPAFLIRRLGGTEGVRDLIKRCYSNVFAPSTAVRSIQLPRLVIAMPAMDGSLSGGQKEETDRTLRETFTDAARSVLGREPVFTNQGSKTPLIYFEELYHPGRSIQGIEQLEKHYLQIDDRVRPLLHFHRGADRLPSLAPARGTRAAMLCGNPGCWYDLTGVEDILFCPGCHGPILNRCGNPGCRANDLTARLEPARIDSNGRPHPSHCPDCQGRLLTYWWKCNVAEHNKEWRSTRDGVCSQCLEEYRAGRRPYLDIRRWNGAAPFDCPGCLSEVADPSKRRRVPNDLRRLFEDGMIPSHAIDFRTSARAARLAVDECLQPEGRAHMLFPSVDFEANSITERRQVYRKGKLFVSSDGSVSTPYSCFHCGHPVYLAAGRRLSNEPVQCARCLRSLHECVYCSHTDHALFTPLVSSDGTKRCPRCDNLMVREWHDYNPNATDGLVDPAYCVNLLSCPAGSRPWSTATDLSRHHCRCCSGGDTGEVLLIDQKRFEAAINRCPHCLSLVGKKNPTPNPDPEGDGDGETILFMDAGRILEHFAGISPTDLEAPCEICAAKPIVVLKWMVNTGYFARLPKHEYGQTLTRLEEDAVGDYALPAIDAETGIDVLRAIREERTPRLLYARFLEVARQNLPPLTVRQELDRLYIHRSVCQQAMERALNDLDKEHIRRAGTRPDRL